MYDQRKRESGVGEGLIVRYPWNMSSISTNGALLHIQLIYLFFIPVRNKSTKLFHIVDLGSVVIISNLAPQDTILRRHQKVKKKKSLKKSHITNWKGRGAHWHMIRTSVSSYRTPVTFLQIPTSIFSVDITGQFQEAPVSVNNRISDYIHALIRR